MHSTRAALVAVPGGAPRILHSSKHCHTTMKQLIPSLRLGLLMAATCAALAACGGGSSSSAPGASNPPASGNSGDGSTTPPADNSNAGTAPQLRCAP